MHDDDARPDPPIDRTRLAEDIARLVRVASVTGDEGAALALVVQIAGEHGLAAELVEHDLAAVRALRGYPGEEAPREALVGALVRLPASGPEARREPDSGFDRRSGSGSSPDSGPEPRSGRLCLNGHVDVVAPGGEAWEHPPFAGVADAEHVHGRGSVDMKGGVVAALHAMAAIASAGVPHPEVVLQAVASEEDGGLGTFAALAADDRFDAALIPEPTGFDVVIAQAGALTFKGVVRGRSAHAAVRLEGVSAIDRYLPIHRALASHETRVNADVSDPLMAALPLPYPLLVGHVTAGRWSSQVPEELVFGGRVGVRVDETIEQARTAFEAVVAAAADEAGEPVELTWTGGQFAPARTPEDHPFVTLVREAAGPDARLAGVPYGADMRHFVARGIPTVMYGTPGLELAHAVDERIRIDDAVTVARTIARVIAGFGVR